MGVCLQPFATREPCIAKTIAGLMKWPDERKLALKFATVERTMLTLAKSCVGTRQLTVTGTTWPHEQVFPCVSRSTGRLQMCFCGLRGRCPLRNVCGASWLQALLYSD